MTFLCSVSITDLLDISRDTVKKHITIFNKSEKIIEEILAKNKPDLLRLFNEKPALLSSHPQLKSDRHAKRKKAPNISMLKAFRSISSKWTDGSVLWNHPGILELSIAFLFMTVKIYRQISKLFTPE